MTEGFRADVLLVRRGLAQSRELAQEMIRAGLVTVGTRPVTKCAEKLPEDADIATAGAPCPYVSRGGYKLEKALQVFREDCRGAVCLDIGASTGGFTDVLLQSGAERVYAVDVGTGQLAEKLLGDPRVVSMEHTNARTLTAEGLDPLPCLAVMDVSFISIRLILPALFALPAPMGRVISLIKPQFEAGRQNLGKNGIVTKPAVREQVLRELAAFPAQYGWTMDALTFSPIRGTEGNTEFLARFVPAAAAGPAVTAADIRCVVTEAQQALKKA